MTIGFGVPVAAPRRTAPPLTMADLRAHLDAALAGTCFLSRELGGGGMSRVFVAEELALGGRPWPRRQTVKPSDRQTAVVAAPPQAAPNAASPRQKPPQA